MWWCVRRTSRLPRIVVRGDAVGDFFAGFAWPIGQVKIDRVSRMAPPHH
jgi:hypothetical protein